MVQLSILPPFRPERSYGFTWEHSSSTRNPSETELCAAEENAEESTEATTPEAKVDEEELAELAVVETE